VCAVVGEDADQYSTGDGERAEEREPLSHPPIIASRQESVTMIGALPEDRTGVSHCDSGGFPPISPGTDPSSGSRARGIGGTTRRSPRSGNEFRCRAGEFGSRGGQFAGVVVVGSPVVVVGAAVVVG